MMTANRKSVSRWTAIAVVAVLLTWAAPGAEARSADLSGTWYLALDLSVVGLPPGATLPAVATFHRDGTFNISDPGDFSSAPFVDFDTTQYGSWYRSNGGRFRATSLFLRKAESGELEGWHRVRFTLRFDEDSDHLVGVVTEEVLPCPIGGPAPFALFNCPDPTKGDFALIPVEIPISGSRLKPRR